MPIPAPKETEQHYVHRAIPVLRSEGKPEAQSVAIAFSMYRQRRKKHRHAKKSAGPFIGVATKQQINFAKERTAWLAKDMAVSPAMSSVDSTTGGAFRAPGTFQGLKPFHRRKLKKKCDLKRNGGGGLISLDEVRKRGEAALARESKSTGTGGVPVDFTDGRTNGLGAGWSYKYASDQLQGYGLDLALHGEPQFDEQALSITFPFAASHGRDRVGDYLDVEGIDTTNHRRNPVAFLDHGKYHHLPIGKCESPEGEYTVNIDKDRGLALCTVFLDRDEGTENGKMAKQVFSLFKSGILRAGSIGYRPMNAPKKLAADPETGTPAGVLLDKVELLEATICGLPANGDAVRRALDAGHNGQPWEPAVKSMLEAQLVSTVADC